MHTRLVRLLPIAVVAFAPALLAQSGATKYLLPPPNVVAAFDAQPLPQSVLSPNRQVLALTYQHVAPDIAELAQPVLRLAGARVNPRNFGPQRTALIYRVTLKRIADGSETTVTVPTDANLRYVKFSPDGSHLSFLNTKENAIELWIADVATGQAKAITGTDRINATTGDPCDWLKDNVTLVCELVPSGRGPAPAEPMVPSGPHIEENYGKAEIGRAHV